MPEQDTFGCRQCWPSDADAAWNARGLLEKVDPIDESHLHVALLACHACAQRFVSVFTETIDRQAGDDAQSWTLMPITGEERARLPAAPSEAELERLGPADETWNAIIRRESACAPAGGAGFASAGTTEPSGWGAPHLEFSLGLPLTPTFSPQAGRGDRGGASGARVPDARPGAAATSSA
jgi:hypothetical protein